MKTQTNNSQDGPDIESIISGLSGNKEARTPQETSLPPEGGKLEDGKLWNEFLGILNDPEEDPDIKRDKLYAIDDDIVETLHLCDFGRHPNVHVINSILRTFLINNILRLKEMQRQRSKSLLDKY